MNKKIGFLFLSVFLLHFVSSFPFSNNLNVQVTDSSGNIQGNTLFTFNFSYDRDSCATSSGVDYSFQQQLTTDKNGIVNLTLTNVFLNFYNTTYNLCYFKDGVLQTSLPISGVPYAYYSLNTSASGILDDSNINIPSYNVTANWFKGLFNWTVSSISSIYLSFTGSELSFNETQLNKTIDNRGVAVGFNSTFNATYAMFAYNQSDGSFNATYATFAYNQTTAVFTMPLLNDTIAQYGTLVGFNSTFNSTYAQFAYNQTLVQSVSGSGIYVVVNPTQGLVVVSLNETQLNLTIANLGNAVGFNSTFNSTYASFAYNQTTAVFTMSLLNDTIAGYGVSVGFNSTFNSTYANFAYNQTLVQSVVGIGPYTIVNPTQGLVNVTLNETKLNSTISDLGVRVGFNSTFNETYNNILGQQCPASFNVNGTLSNGTFTCSNLTQVVRSVHGAAPYLSVDNSIGTVTMTFNETKSNQTINSLIGIANKTTLHCSNITGQGASGLCTTGSPTFVNINAQNITSTGQLFSNQPGVSGTWHIYSVLGGAVEVGRVTSDLGVFQFRSASNLDIYFSNDDTTGFFSVNDLGETLARTSRTFYVDNGAIRFFESNVTGTRVYGNLSIGGTRINSPCPLGNEGCIANFTGYNITSNHQSYNMTSLINLDTNYRNNNTNGRPIRVSMDFDVDLQLDVTGAVGLVTLYVNGSEVDSEGMVDVNLGGSTGKWRFSVEGDVQPGLTYSFNSTTSSATVTKRAVWIYVD